MKSVPRLTFLAAVGFCALATGPAQADFVSLISCHISGGCNPPTSYGTVTLTQSGRSVNVTVTLDSGNRFVETAAGGGKLFLFNDAIAGSTITNASATLNGVTQSLSISGFTNLSPVQADDTGTFTASVECTVASDCNGGSTPNINDLHFTVTNATLGQLETLNANENMFVADILCGATQFGCTAGLWALSIIRILLLLLEYQFRAPPGCLAPALAGLGLLGWRRKKKAIDAQSISVLVYRLSEGSVP